MYEPLKVNGHCWYLNIGCKCVWPLGDVCLSFLVEFWRKLPSQEVT